MTLKQNFKGGTHYHHYHFTQQELNLETKVPCTFRIAPKLLDIIEKRSRAAGIPRSKFIENILIKYFKSEKKLKDLYSILDDIIGNDSF